MRVLVDESCPRAFGEILAAAGHDVVAVAAAMAGTPDRALADLAIAESRLVLTEDFDFGDLVIRDGLDIPGVILMAVATRDVGEKVERLEAAIALGEQQLRHHLTVVDAKRIRRRRLREA